MSVDDVEQAEESRPEPVKRLCNEIQLFDLCDLESCRYKDGRFCTNEDLLSAFERISDVEVRRAPEHGDDEDDMDEFEDEYDDAYEDGQDDDAGYDEDY